MNMKYFSSLISEKTNRTVQLNQRKIQTIHTCIRKSKTLKALGK